MKNVTVKEETIIKLLDIVEMRLITLLDELENLDTKSPDEWLERYYEEYIAGKSN